MQAIKSIKLLITAIAIWAIPVPVDSQEPEVAEPNSTSETVPSNPSQSKNASYYKPTNNIGIIADVGAEGGADSDVHLISIVNEEEFASSALQNVHTQIYLKFFAQEADVVAVSSLKEKTNYYPHLSFTGNITDSQNVIRYYAGAIFNEPLKLYLGADYNHQALNNF